MGLLYLAAVLRKAGNGVQILDGEVDQMDHSVMADRVVKERPTIFGITATTAQANRAFTLAAEVKARSPETFVVLGGAHASALTRECLEESDALDAVAFGEGEVTMLELLDRVRNRESLEGLPGIAYRDGDTITVNPPAS